MMGQPAHVLILGCGRSGTSIFGELFQQLPGYSYHSEPPFADLIRLDYTRPQAVKVPRESPDYPAPPGLSFPLETLFEVMPPPRQIFWQVRHPLDTIASLKVGISRNWGHHPRPPDWEQWVSAPLVARCAHHWQCLNSVGFQQLADLAVISRFEDMLADSLAFARRISRQVGLDPTSLEPALQQWAQRVQNSNNEQFVEAETSRPYSTRDHQVRVGRWRENLSPEEVELIWPMVEDTARVFGYER